MALPEGYRPRKGDILQLRGIVEYDTEPNENRIFVKIKGVYSMHSVDLDEVELKCRGWNTDDSVMPINRIAPYEKPASVLCIHDEYVWIDDPHTGPSTYHANSLEPWVPAKSALVLVMDEAAVKELVGRQVIETLREEVEMKEPPPAPLLAGGEDAPKPADPADDDDLPF